MAAYVWQAVDGSFDAAGNWANTTFKINPARTSPGISDAATLNTGGGTVSGAGSVGSLNITGANLTAWSLAGQIRSASTLINGRTGITAAGSIDAGSFALGVAGALSVALGGVLRASSLTLSAGATLDIAGAGAAIVGSSAGTAGALTVDAGATLTSHGGTIRGDLIQNGALSNDGGLTVTGNLDGPGAVGLSAGLLSVGGSLGAAALSFTGAHATLMANGLQGVSTASGFQAGDAIDLAGVTNAVLTTGAAGAIVSAGGGSIVLGAAPAGTAFALHGDGHGGTSILLDAAVPPDMFLYTDVSLNTSASAAGEVYAGPLTYLQHQYIWPGADKACIAATVSNVFLKGGTGDDALQASGGSNVLDGGTGSNFLTGGSGGDGGTDTFFVDCRPAGVTWSTLVNFHSGDSATIFGFHAGLSTMPLTASDGTAGYQGATIHSEIGGAGTGIQGSITFAGISEAAAAAQFEFTTGTLPDSTEYLLIHFR